VNESTWDEGERAIGYESFRGPAGGGLPAIRK
jgi:hypothetical protein